MKPRAHRTLLPAEIKLLWGPFHDAETSFQATREWLAFLEAMTVSGMFQLPYGSYLG